MNQPEPPYPQVPDDPSEAEGFNGGQPLGGGDNIDPDDGLTRCSWCPPTPTYRED